MGMGRFVCSLIMEFNLLIHLSILLFFCFSPAYTLTSIGFEELTRKPNSQTINSLLLLKEGMHKKINHKVYTLCKLCQFFGNVMLNQGKQTLSRFHLRKSKQKRQPTAQNVSI